MWIRAVLLDHFFRAAETIKNEAATDEQVFMGAIFAAEIVLLVAVAGEGVVVAATAKMVAVVVAAAVVEAV